MEPCSLTLKFLSNAYHRPFHPWSLPWLEFLNLETKCCLFHGKCILSLILHCLGGLAPFFLYLEFRAMWLDVVYYNASRVKSYVWDPFQQHKNLANRLYWTVFFQGLLRESITLFAQLYSSGYKLLCKRLLQCNMHKTFKRHVIITMQAIRFFKHD